jgi:antitoxin (DNA-binding transcriptional repressor) of toxin-antitoxin stability system
MMAYTTYEARTRLSRMLREAEAGQEVMILRGKKPVVKIVPIRPAAPRDRNLSEPTGK